MLAVYTFVFTVIFQSRWGGEENSRSAYAIIMLCGLATFNIFSESLGTCCGEITKQQNYVKKVVFPLEILPIARVFSSLVLGLAFSGGGTFTNGSPHLPLPSLSIAAITVPSYRNVIMIIGILGWPAVCRIVRSKVLYLKNMEYVEAARSLGLSQMEIIFRHILPNIAGPLLVTAALVAFAACYPQTVFAVGSRTATLYAVPVCTALFALFGWMGLRRSFHFFVLTLLAFTVVFLVIGVMGHGWYLPEISGIFLAMGILAGYASGKNADGIIKEFMAGAKDILSAAIVVGLAGGIIQVLQEGRIIDPILHGLASLLSEAGRLVSLWGMYVIQTLINLIIPSGSAKAALTMPIMAPFSDVIGISRQATVMAYQFGDGFTNMLTPTSAVLMGALGIARIPYDVWVKWFGKILLLLIVLGFVLLIPTITLNLPGF